MKLRNRVNLILTGLSAVFVTVLLVADLLSTRVAVHEEITAAHRIAAQLLGHLAAQHGGDNGTAPLLAYLEELGRVRAHDVTLYSPAGAVLYASPPSTWKAGRDAPRWFAHLMTPGEGRQSFRLADGSLLLVEAEASRAVLDGWDDFVWLLSVAAVMLVVVNGVAFWSAGRAVQPFPVIARGLERVQQGELDYRLPPLDGAEARTIGEAFNAMAAAVQDKVAAEREAREARARLEERRELARLIEQRLEEERHLIAHELHDEFSQSVTAIRSLAMAIATRTDGTDADAAATGDTRETGGSTGRGVTAEKDDGPQEGAADIAETARFIADEAGRLYDAMHGLIPRLQPLTLDTLGLADTLENLIRDWRRRRPEVALSSRYEVSLDLGHSITLAVYRVAQEGLINALRHARASHVEVAVRSDGDRILVSVSDDGIGLREDWSRPGHFGLRGLAARVDSLDGRLSVRNREPRGVELRAQIPLSASASGTAASR